MPIYAYIASESGCQSCKLGFDRLEKMNDPPLLACPDCGAPIHRVISAPALAVGKAHLFKEKNIAEKGFTQYRKIGKGVYEKTAGKGPNIISGD